MPLENKAGVTGLPTMDREGADCTILQTGYVSQGWTHMGPKNRGCYVYFRGGYVMSTSEMDGNLQILYISFRELLFYGNYISPKNSLNDFIQYNRLKQFI